MLMTASVGSAMLRPFVARKDGLNGSMQHLLKGLLSESKPLSSFADVNAKKTKVLYRL